MPNPFSPAEVALPDDAKLEPLGSFHVPSEPYLTDRIVAARLSLSPKTLAAKVRQGVFVEGRHFFQPAGMRRRWIWPAVVAWLEGAGTETSVQARAISLASSSRGRAIR